MVVHSILVLFLEKMSTYNCLLMYDSDWNIKKRKTCSVHAVTFTALEANPIPRILTDEFLPLSPTRRQHSNIDLNRCAALKEVRMPNESRSTIDDSSTIASS